MNLDKNISERIEMMRFPLIAGVVFIHAFPISMNMDKLFGINTSTSATYIVRTLFSEVLGRISVPMLFLLAGFLFFQGFDTDNRGDARFHSLIIKKWKSRVRTLLVPFLIWNVAALLFMLAIQHSPWSFLFANTANVSDFRTWDALNAIFGITHAPIAYQFWFVRNLIFFVLIAPAVYFVIRKAPHVWLTFMGAFWLLQLWTIRVPDAAGMFFFTFGAYLALHPVNLQRVHRWLPGLTIAYALLAFLDLSYKAQWFSGRLDNLTNAVGVVFVFALTQKLWEHVSLRKALIAIAPASFFVFATHEPLLTIVRKISYLLIEPATERTVILLYFANPILVIAACTLVYKVLAAKLPRFAGWITGGR